MIVPGEEPIFTGISHQKLSNRANSSRSPTPTDKRHQLRKRNASTLALQPLQAGTQALTEQHRYLRERELSEIYKIG